MSRLLQELGEIKDIVEELDSYGMLVTETKNINTYCKDIFRNANIFLLELLNIWGSAAENEINVKWHPYPKEKPPKEGDYLVTLVVGVKPFTHYLHYAPFTLGRGSKWAHVTAWMDNPEPYKDEESI